MFTKDLPIINRKGLHARASAKFVQLAELYDAEITVSRSGETAGGTSIMALLTLAAGQGTSVTVTTAGPDAEVAMTAIETLLANRFGEDE